MRIVVLPADTGACGSYRLKWPSDVIQELKPDWEIETYLPGSLRLSTDRRGRLNAVKGIDSPGHVDLYVLQRVGSPRVLEFIHWAQANGSAVVVDSDDAMWCIDPKNPAAKSWSKNDSHWRIMDKAADVADLVTVTTPLLANRYGGHGRVEILPNAIPKSVMDLEIDRTRLPGTVSFGWAGFTITHPGDLVASSQAARYGVHELGLKPLVVADAKGAARDWGLDSSLVEEIPAQSLGLDYFRALSHIDIGFVPLKESTFNRGKSYLKALEFASVGVPSIVSDTPAHRELAKTVPLRIARNAEEWISHLRYLAQDEIRLHEGAMARKAVESFHLIESRGLDWLSAWERAISRRERLSA